MGQIITIGQRHWLAGMSWASYVTAPGKEELQSDALRLTQTPQWFALRHGEEAIQAGFSRALNARHPKKMSSLAAAMADSKAQPWCGRFQLADDLFWYIAVRDENAILPDGDVIGSKDEVDAARERHAEFDDWNVVEGDFDLLKSLLKSSDCKPTPVRSLHRNKLSVTSKIVTGMVVAGLAVGIWQWQEHKNETKFLRAQLQQKLRMQDSVKPPPTAKEILATMPIPSLWLSVCRDALYPLALSKYGWQLNHVECQATSAIAHWKRGEGATVAERPHGTLLASDNAIDQLIPLTFNDKNGSEQLVTLTMAQQALRAWVQARGFALRIEQLAKQTSLPGAQPPEPAATLPSSNQNFTIDMPSPFSSGADFDSIPGLRLTSMKSLPGGLWSVQGVIYGS